MARATVAMHERARDESRAAFVAIFGREPSLCERQYLQAVALLETTYGYGWRWSQGAEAVGSNNMGAIQAGKPPCNPATSFETSDTREDGTVYRWCYKKYPTRAAGWADLVRTLYQRRPTVLERASACDIDGAVSQQRETGYFELALTKYQAAMWSGLTEIAAALGEPLPPKAG